MEHLLAALKDFGFGALGLTIADFEAEDNVIQLGYEPCRIDLLVSVEGLIFEDCYEYRSEGNFENTTLNFLNIDDLIKAKTAAGRPQDIADAHKLSKIKAKMKE